MLDSFLTLYFILSIVIFIINPVVTNKENTNRSIVVRRFPLRIFPKKGIQIRPFLFFCTLKLCNTMIFMFVTDAKFIPTFNPIMKIATKTRRVHPASSLLREYTCYPCQRRKTFGDNFACNVVRNSGRLSFV